MNSHEFALNPKIIKRDDVAKVLKAWQAGEMSTREVYDWANRLYPCNYDAEDWEGEEEQSVTNEVLAALDMLDMNLTLPEDVSIYLDFLDTPKGDFASGYAAFEQRLRAIDYATRKKRLKDGPLYTPFLKDVSR
jgi:hypothetical protein